MSVSAIQASTTPVIGAPSRDNSGMTDIDFMNLLVAQIQNQDPLSPMDNAQFTTQITQFSMLEQLTGLGGKLDENNLMAQAINNTAMLALVGREVTVEGDGVGLTDGAASRNELNANAAGTATVEVLDAAGDVVATYTRTVAVGLNPITWDGKLANGDQAPDGDYTLRAKVQNSSGEEVAATVLMTGPVEGLHYENNTAVVTVFGQDFSVSDIYQVS